MPITREDHVIYTRSELENNVYYVDMLRILKDAGIKSYLDIGANVGEFCNVMMEKIPSLKKAYLVEPECDNFLFMLGNVNNVHDVETFNVAIGYDIVNPTMSRVDNNVGGFFLCSGTSPSVNVSTLEDLDLPIVDFVKIDIEGGETNLVENSSYLNDVSYIDIEWHNERFFDRGAVEEYLSHYLPHKLMLMHVNRTLLKL
jgi:FkbM family methyltransferase